MCICLYYRWSSTECGAPWCFCARAVWVSRLQTGLSATVTFGRAAASCICCASSTDCRSFSHTYFTYTYENRVLCLGHALRRIISLIVRALISLVCSLSHTHDTHTLTHTRFVSLNLFAFIISPAFSLSLTHKHSPSHPHAHALHRYFSPTVRMWCGFVHLLRQQHRLQVSQMYVILYSQMYVKCTHLYSQMYVKCTHKNEILVVSLGQALRRL